MRFRFILISIGLIFASMYAAEGFLFRDYNLDEFQVATGYLKDRDPNLFPSDFIWSQPEMTRNLHVSVRGLMRFTDWVTGERFSEPADLFLLWLPLCVFAFYLGIYLLSFRFTGDRWASLLIACSFMLVRRTVWDWWGLGPTYTMSARGYVLGFLPLAFHAFLQCRGNLARLAGCFLLWGVVSNLHPLSGWGFVEFLGVTLLIRDRFAARAWSQCIVMGAATLIGSIPFLMIWTGVVKVPPELQADPSVVKAFWDGFMGLELPQGHFIWEFVQDLFFPLGLSIMGWFVWRRMGKPGDSQEMRLLCLFPFVVIGMIFFVMIAGNIVRRTGVSLPVMVPEHCRNLKFVYLTLPIWMGFALVGWFHQFKFSPRLLKYGVPTLGILISMAINFPGHKLMRVALDGMGWLSANSSQRLANWRREDAADLEVSLWAREHTPREALFYFDSYEFRYYARRSLVFCWFDRPCVGYRPTRDLQEWIRRRDRVSPLKKNQDIEGMMAAAKEYRADYLVALKRWPTLRQEPVWSNEKYRIYRVMPQGKAAEQP